MSLGMYYPSYDSVLWGVARFNNLGKILILFKLRPYDVSSDFPVLLELVSENMR